MHRGQHTTGRHRHVGDLPGRAQSASRFGAGRLLASPMICLTRRRLALRLQWQCIAGFTHRSSFAIHRRSPLHTLSGFVGSTCSPLMVFVLPSAFYLKVGAAPLLVANAPPLRMCASYCHSGCKLPGPPHVQCHRPKVFARGCMGGVCGRRHIDPSRACGLGDWRLLRVGVRYGGIVKETCNGQLLSAC